MQQSKPRLAHFGTDMARSFLSTHGFNDEVSFWESVSTLSSPTTQSVTTNMESALAKWGFNKTDLRQNLRDWFNFIGKNVDGYTSDSASNFSLMMNGSTFFKDYSLMPTGEVTAARLAANFSMGSPTATVTWSGGASNPRTYVDDSGLIQLSTTSNTGRKTAGFYSTSGFVSRPGLLMEGASTNLLVRTDGTASVSGRWTGWGEAHSTANASTQSQVSVSSLTGIAGSYSQRLQYVDGADTTKLIRLYSTATAAGTVVNTNTVTFSCWLRSQTGITGASVRLNVEEYDASLVIGTIHSSSVVTPTTAWKRFTYTVAMVDADCSRVIPSVDIYSIDQGDTADLEVWGPQIEVSPFATTFIPTTTAALTRNAETLTYPISGNRTAATESIFIKATPFHTYSTLTAFAYLSDTDTKSRYILNRTSGIEFRPNNTDSSTSSVSGLQTGNAAYTSLTSAYVCKHSSPYVGTYRNGTSQGTDTDDFTDPAWGTNFYVGSASAGNQQWGGIISSLAIFSDAKGASDVAAISALMAAS